MLNRDWTILLVLTGVSANLFQSAMERWRVNGSNNNAVLLHPEGVLGHAFFSTISSPAAFSSCIICWTPLSVTAATNVVSQDTSIFA